MVRPLPRATISLLLLCALTFGPIAQADAQKPTERDFLMTLAGVVGRDQEKIVRASIDDQDPSALVSIDPTAKQVKIRTIAALDLAALNAGFAPYGVSIISLEPIAVLNTSARAMAVEGLPGFPVLLDTGDPVNDQAVYQTNKAAWIEAHPELYPPIPRATVPSQR